MADLTGLLPSPGQNPWTLNTAITAVNNDVENRLLSSAAPELIRDTIGTALVAGANITINVNDGTDQITISSAGLDTEAVQDTVAAMLVAGTNVTLNYDDVANTLTINATGGGGVSDWGDIGGTLSDQTDLQTALNGKSNTGHTHVISNVTDLETALNDRATKGTTAVIVQYDDGWPTYDTDPDRVRDFRSQHDETAEAPTFYNVRDSWLAYHAPIEG